MTRQHRKRRGAVAAGLLQGVFAGACVAVAASCGAGSSAQPAAPVAAATASGERKLSHDDRAGVERVLAEQSAAWNRGDLEGYMAGYLRSPDLVFTSGSKVRTGYDETIASYRKRYGTDRASMGTLVFTLMRVDPVGQGGAIALGRWDLQLASGPVGGVFSVVLERTPRGWLIVHDHTSSDPPPQ